MKLRHCLVLLSCLCTYTVFAGQNDNIHSDRLSADAATATSVPQQNADQNEAPATKHQGQTAQAPAVQSPDAAQAMPADDMDRQSDEWNNANFDDNDGE